MVLKKRVCWEGWEVVAAKTGRVSASWSIRFARGKPVEVAEIEGRVVGGGAGAGRERGRRRL